MDLNDYLWEKHKVLKSLAPQLHRQDKKHSERIILCKLRRMTLGTGQRKLTKALKQLEGFFWRRITAATQARSQKDDRTLYLKKPKTHFFRQIDYFGEQMPPFYLLDALLGRYD